MPIGFLVGFRFFWIICSFLLLIECSILEALLTRLSFLTSIQSSWLFVLGGQGACSARASLIEPDGRGQRDGYL